MGIKNLGKFLIAKCKSGDTGVKNHRTVEEFRNSEETRLFREYVARNKINNPVKQMEAKANLKSEPFFMGVDGYFFAYKYKQSLECFLHGFLRQIAMTLASRMIPIYVFDGTAPVEKRKTIADRQRKKNKYRKKLNSLLLPNIGPTSELTFSNLMYRLNKSYSNFSHTNRFRSENIRISDLDKAIHHSSPATARRNNECIKLFKKSVRVSNDDIKNLKELLDLLNIPYVTATGEADDLLAFLYKNGIIQACQSDDMDLLPKGCGNLVKITKDGVVQYLLPQLLDTLELSHEQFVDLCILLGCDYYTAYLPPIKPDELYRIYMGCSKPSIESFVSVYSKIDERISKHLKGYVAARKMFAIQDIHPGQKTEFNCKLQMIQLNDIRAYFRRMGMALDEKQLCTIKSILVKANDFILSTHTRNTTRHIER